MQNGNIQVKNADVSVNGSLTGKNNGGVKVTGGTLSVEEGTSGKAAFQADSVLSGSKISDPLAWLSLPPDMSDLHRQTGSACDSGPGIYTSLNLKSCTLDPGLYVVTGSNHYSGQTTVVGHRVTFYFTCETGVTVRSCDSDEEGGDLLLTGRASLTVSPPTEGPLKGLAILSDRNNTATIGFRGNGATGSSGTIYLPSGTLDYRGNGSGGYLDSLIVVNDVTFKGNPSGFNTTYTQENNVAAPPTGVHLCYLTATTTPCN